MLRILIIDNRDSFVYNLVELLRSTQRVEITIQQAEQIQLDELYLFDGILLSPGAAQPTDYPAMMHLIEHAYRKYPILGVCLGHQALAVAFGASLQLLEKPKHGQQSFLQITHPCALLKGIPNQTAIGRYHSWRVESQSLPADLQVCATDEEGNGMVIAHQSLPLFGVQFHPESIISEQGLLLINNWLDCVEKFKREKVYIHNSLQKIERAL